MSVRIAVGLLEQLDDLAHEMDRSRSYLITLAVREFVEREYLSLSAIRAGEQTLSEGKGVPHDQASAWIDDVIAGKGRPKAFR